MTDGFWQMKNKNLTHIDVKIFYNIYKIYFSHCLLDTGPRSHIHLFLCKVSLLNFTRRLPF